MTPMPDIWQILAQDAAPFVILAYILIDATKRMERVMLAAIELMRHCDCHEPASNTPSSG